MDELETYGPEQFSPEEEDEGDEELLVPEELDNEFKAEKEDI